MLLLSFSFVGAHAAPLIDLNSETLAVQLVIDTSGSMNTTDPQRLREQVANVFIDYLNPEDYLGIITFNSSVDLVIPMDQLKDEATRISYKERLSPKLVGIADTDYKAALDEANKQLEGLYRHNVNKIVIFLTDGKPDPDPINISNNTEKMNLYMDGLWGSVSKLSNNKFPVYSIGFSDGIDVEILNRIATETKGDVRIFKDSTDLNNNLVQMLKSREMIVAELLAPASTSVVNVKPSLTTDFWLKSQGYRNGEEAVISASLVVGSTRINSGNDLKVDKFELMIDYDDGSKEVVNLYDDGTTEHSDIRVNDGIWSNKLVFNKNGSASANLVMSGKLKDKDITLKKVIGNYIVGNPGNILVTTYEKDLWIKGGERLSIPLRFDNQSTFKEIVFVEIDEGFGNLIQKKIELEPETNKGMQLDIDVSSVIENKIHNIIVSLRTLEGSTKIDKSTIDYNVEIVSYFENLSRKLEGNSSIIIPILGIIIGLPLLIFLLGLLLYLILVKPQLKIRGRLIYWQQFSPDDKVELDLTKKKKTRIIISLDSLKTADFQIIGSRFNYDIEIFKVLLKKRMKFILGWKSLFSKKELTELVISCTQPGIIEHDGDIFTKMNLYDEDEFLSGGLGFKFSISKSKWSKDASEGKDLLEGRV